MADLSVIYRIAADISGLQTGVDRAAKATEGLESSAKSLQKALTAAFSIAAITKLGADVVGFASTLSDLSAQTGITTTGLQKLGLAFEASGVGVETIATNSVKLAKALVEGDKSTVGALQALGLSVGNLKRLAPEDQFVAVADAIGKIESPTEKAYAAMAIFGKGGSELLKGLTGDLASTTAQFEKMGFVVSEENIKALDDFGDQVGLMGKQLLAVVATIVGPLMPALTGMANALMVVAKVVGDVGAALVKWIYGGLLAAVSAIEKFVAGIADLAQKIPFVGKHLGVLGDAADWLRKDAAAADTEVAKLFGSTDTLGTTAQKTAPKLLGLGKATDDAAKAAKEAEKAWKELLDRLRDVEGNKATFKTLDLTEALKGIGTSGAVPALKDISLWSLRAATDVDGLRGSTEQLQRQGLFLSATMATVNKQFAVLPEGIDAGSTAMAGFRKAEQDAADATLVQVESLDTLAQKLQQTFSAQNIGNLVTKGLTGGGGFTGALKGLTAQAGQDITTDLANTLKLNLGGKMGDLLGGIIGPLGSLLGPALGKVTGWIGSLFGNNPEKQINPIREAFVQLHGGLAALGEQARLAGVNLQAMLNAKNPEQYQQAISNLTAALDFQQSALATLQQTADKYGFTLAELGPAMARGELDKKAQELYQDFKVLTAGGIEVDTVITKMSGSINEFVQNAIVTGTEVPAAMKPMLQRMVDLGLLVDKNGDKFESLEDTGVSFSETMTQGFNKIVASVQKLTEAIARGLGVALDNLPSEQTIELKAKWTVEDLPEIPGQIEPVTLATGGLVTTRGVRPVTFQPKGTDTVPAMLTPGEMVLTAPEQATIARTLAGTGTAAPSVMVSDSLALQFDIQAIDTRDMQQAVEKDILPIIVRELEDRRRGYAGRIARTLQGAA